jgi:hypothetical protein
LTVPSALTKFPTSSSSSSLLVFAIIAWRCFYSDVGADETSATPGVCWFKSFVCGSTREKERRRDFEKLEAIKSNLVLRYLRSTLFAGKFWQETRKL